jgi:hypothetical protein
MTGLANPAPPDRLPRIVEVATLVVVVGIILFVSLVLVPTLLRPSAPPPGCGAVLCAPPFVAASAVVVTCPPDASFATAGCGPGHFAYNLTVEESGTS